MKINKISLNNFNSINPQSIKKPCKTNAIKDSIQFTGDIVSFEQISAAYPNVSSKDVNDLYGFCNQEGYNITLKQVKRALSNYRKDAYEAKPFFKRANKVLNEFEDKISKIDFKSLEKITSIFENEEREKKEQESDWFFEYTPSSESRKTMKNIAQMYIDILTKELPEYEFEIADDGSDNPTNYYMQISAQKGDDVLLFFYEDFVKSLQNGKLEPNVNIIMATPKEYDHYYLYEGNEGLLSKVDKLNNEAVGIISKNSYDFMGKPVFYLDDCTSSGPTYYALAETLKVQKSVEEEVNLDNVEGLDEEILQIIKNSIKQDILVERFYKKYGLAFVLSCIRDGEFNMKIAQSSAHLAETVKYYSKDNNFSQVYINDIIATIEDDDHNVNEYLLDIAQEFLTKECSLNKDYHDIIINTLTYIKENINYSTIKLGENLSDEFFSFEEVNLVMNMLTSSNKKEQRRIISKLNKLAVDYDVADAYKPAMRLFQALLYELNRKN